MATEAEQKLSQMESAERDLADDDLFYTVLDNTAITPEELLSRKATLADLKAGMGVSDIIFKDNRRAFQITSPA